MVFFFFSIIRTLYRPLGAIASGTRIKPPECKPGIDLDIILVWRTREWCVRDAAGEGCGGRFDFFFVRPAIFFSAQRTPKEYGGKRRGKKWKKRNKNRGSILCGAHNVDPSNFLIRLATTIGARRYHGFSADGPCCGGHVPGD